MLERKVGVLTEKLTDKQENFVLALINGKSQREAYRSAYKADRMADKTVDEKASRLFAQDKVRARFEELQAKVRGEAEQRGVASAADVLEELSNIGMGRKEYPGYDMFGNPCSRYPSVTQRTKALELLGKKYGLFSENVKHSGTIGIENPLAGLTTEELRKLAGSDG